MLHGTYKTLYENLLDAIPAKRLFSNPIHTLAWGTDASFYRLIPKLVIKAHHENEVAEILRQTHALKIPVTFRAAGTSLSGQAISDSVLLVASDNWKDYEILDEGKKIRLQPGIIGSRANILLAPYGRKIGPDPASINAAMIGGIVANNASGMCCGTAENSYNTIESLKLVFADGTRLDTADKESCEQFKIRHPKILENINRLAQQVKNNTKLSDRIREKYKMKNTTGFSLNALVDFSDPFDIINHLVIGSEGTLAFVSEVTYNTVHEHAFKATSLMVFPDTEKACEAVLILKQQDVAAVELIDRAGLRSVENNEGMPQWLKTLQPDVMALLVETRADNQEHLNENIEKIKKSLKPIPVVRPITFTDIPSEYIALWNIRKGLFPSVGAMRRTGTTVIIEDVAFPLPVLAQATLDLQKLFAKYDYHEAVIFGHALEGNLHFVFNQDFGTINEVERYARFMDELAELVVTKYDGALKAEHGTGRNMAPYVLKEWGEDAVKLMREIKEIFDPHYLLNPGVILNDNPQIHLENLKPLAPVNEIVDKCIECGFCEPVCVSNDLTLSPRQRIVVLREMKRLEKSGHQPHILASLSRDFIYEGDKTCATDGLCAINCPVKIDTGEMIKSIRMDERGSFSKKMATVLSGNTAKLTWFLKGLLNMVYYFHKVLGTKVMNHLTKALRNISGNRIPLWNQYMPRGSKRIKSSFTSEENPNKVVYFPSCINRTMGISSDYEEEIPLTDKLPSLLKKAGFDVIYPEKLKSLCCGMAYFSKGFKQQGIEKSEELKHALLKASGHGKYSVLCDMSPCLYTMKNNMEPDLKLFEPVTFILEFLAEKLEFTPVDETIAVFSVCSAKKMGLEASLVKLAKMCSSKVVDVDANCCGFAGDKGFSHPELNAHGLGDLNEQTVHCLQGYSTSRTCEIGLSLHSDVSFKSIIYLVDKVTTPKSI
ncbi:MAG: FAD-binding oxidoreductase [Bacteroidetes bacterium]|nr:MAG: FAD-binding oxidoreductase [Bacteroidota bacterium]